MLKHCNALQPIANRAALLACLVLSPTTWAHGYHKQHAS